MSGKGTVRLYGGVEQHVREGNCEAVWWGRAACQGKEL